MTLFKRYCLFTEKHYIMGALMFACLILAISVGIVYLCLWPQGRI
jgi:hypothetical protein